MEKTYDIMTVSWIDSEAVDGWQSKYEYHNYPGEEFVLCNSVGYLYGETDDALTIVTSISKDQVSGLMRIPRVAIKDSQKIGTWTDDHAFVG